EFLRELARGINLLGELTPRNRDQFLACGERASSTIFHAALSEALPKRNVTFYDATNFFVTTNDFTHARPLMPETTRHLTPIARELRAGAVGVTQGFIGATTDRHTTTIGRGGSDFSAALMGVAAKAREIQIWT